MELACERKTGKIYRANPWCFYEVNAPNLTDKEKDFVDSVTSLVQNGFYATGKRAGLAEKTKKLMSSIEQYPDPEREKKASRPILEFVKQTASFSKHKSELADALAKELVGLGKLSYLLRDDDLEEIMANAPGQPIFVFDRKYGLCKTSLAFDSPEEMLSLIRRIASFTDKRVTKERPLLEARLPDGSRINSTIPPASPKGPTITIRKFRKKPFTITDMVKNNTMTPEVAAFLWLCVEGMKTSPKNMMVAGSTGCGKTTTLNALSVFIPQKERIVTIEELNLHGREDWIQLEARPGVHESPIGMIDLLKSTIRMRPDRIIVGEVRGEEAESLFVAMDLGHQGVMSTMHSNTARETITRLKNPPMSIPISMFTLLDLIVMQHRMYDPKLGSIRRVTELAEVSVMDDHVLLNDIFARDRLSDTIVRTDIPSQIEENFSFLTGLTKRDIRRELLSRKEVIDFLAKNSVCDYPDIQKIVNAYYADPQSLLSKIE